jgi:vitamin B12 transporter
MNKSNFYIRLPGLFLIMIMVILPLDNALCRDSNEPDSGTTAQRDRDTGEIINTDGDSGEEKTEEKDATVELEDVVVTATRTDEEILDVPQHVTVITGEEIRQGGKKSLADILETEAGIGLTDYGGEGSLKTLSLRGCTSSQVLVLVNGVRSPGSHGGSDLSLISTENIDRIEIVRGGTSALYGADAVGGVINILTKKKEKNSFSFHLENTSFLPQNALKGTGSDEYEAAPGILTLLDTQKASIGFSYNVGDFSINSTVNGTMARNEFIFMDPTYQMRMRDNAGVTGGDASCNLTYSLEHGSVSLSGNGAYRDQGVPGAIGSLTPEAHQIQQCLGSSLHYKTDKFFTDLLTLDLKGYYNIHQVDYEEPRGSVSSLHTNQSGGIDVSQELFALDYVSFLYGGTVHYEVLESTDMGEKSRLNYAGFAEIPIYPSLSLTLLPSLRYDYFSDFNGNLTYKLGAVWRLSSSLSVKGSVARSYRAPTFNDLYWPADAFAEGNPDLRPESGYCGDVGVTLIKETYSMNTFLFLRYIEDVIFWRPGPDTIWRPENFGRGLYPGIEVQWEAQFLDYCKAGIQYTGMYTFALSGDLAFEDDRRIPYVPVHSLDAFVQYHREKTTLSVNTHYEGIKFLSTDNKQYLLPVIIFNMYYKYDMTRFFSFYIALDNLFDEIVQSRDNYPVPGFSLRTGFTFLFQ